ncbi:hypothetical protein CTAYLR_004567 [Chrysophaeum taylorii]|uniref:Tyrosinase copper-binding domain-containing protein n=1 Tax=Chrysophaeum taylorii TaxID=2483200 RepID=A0AAD7XLX5_9STRA|nr:hypothetical protein CTAYLR_004567 [Chrysophaeum taylorii]
MYNDYGSIEKQKSEPAVRSRRKVRLVALVGVLLLGLVATYRRRGVVVLRSDKEEEFTSTTPGVQRYCWEGVCVFASNSYERNLRRPIANGLYDGIILELFETTRVEVLGEEDCEVSSDLESVNYGGCRLDVTATKVGVFELRSGRLKFELVARYVRREVRDLTAVARSRLLDAIAVTHAVPDAVGQQMYGPRYRSAAWFTRQHHFWSSDRECDHWHSGSGFVNNHLGFTRRYEQTLQEIDEKIAMAYWDYTIEYVTRDCCWTESVLWSSDWFSTVSPNNSLHVVDSGRFAYLPIPKGNGNAYGNLMSPWNTDPTPFLTRSDSILGLKNYVNVPDFGCDEFRKIFLASHEYGGMIGAVSVSLHAPVHGAVGGYWNYIPELKADEPELSRRLYNASSAINIASKLLWRKGVLQCPSFCAPDTPAVDCACGGNDPVLAKHYQNFSPWDILNATGCFESLKFSSEGEFDASDRNATIWGIVLRQILNVGHLGQVVSDASPNDPIFWIIHGMQERFVQQLRYLNDTGAWNFDQTWKTVSSSYYDCTTT